MAKHTMKALVCKKIQKIQVKGPLFVADSNPRKAFSSLEVNTYRHRG